MHARRPDHYTATAEALIAKLYEHDSEFLYRKDKNGGDSVPTEILVGLRELFSFVDIGSDHRDKAKALVLRRGLPTSSIEN